MFRSYNVEYYRIDHLESVQHVLLDLQEEDELSTFVAGASESTDEGKLVDAYIAERRYVVEEYKAVSTADVLPLGRSLTFEQLENDIDQTLRGIKKASRTDWRQEYQERQKCVIPRSVEEARIFADPVAPFLRAQSRSRACSSRLDSSRGLSLLLRLSATQDRTDEGTC